MKKFFIILMVSLTIITITEAVTVIPKNMNWRQRYTPTGYLYNKKPLPSNFLSPQYDETQAKYFYHQRNPALTPISTTKSSGSSLPINTNSTLVLTFKSLVPQKSITHIPENPISIFQVQVKNTTKTKTNVFTEAVLLRKMQFGIFSNSGIVTDPTQFDLTINDQVFQFEKNGTVTLDFANLRLPNNESQSLDIGFQVHNKEALPHGKGGLKVRFLGATSQTETFGNPVTIFSQGSTISSFLIFDLSPASSGVPVFHGSNGGNIIGKTLSAGKQAYVLALNFEAAYDDLLIQEITIRNTDVSGKDIDSFAQKLEAIDGSSGKILGSSSFVNGAAHFRFNPSIQVLRNGTQVGLVFRITMTSMINPGLKNEFKLGLAPEDLKIMSASNGNQLSLTNENISVQSDTFSVVQSGGGMSISPSNNQPNGFSVDSSLSPVFRFSISNPGDGDVSISRISFMVSLNGINFPGNSISANDFALYVVQNGHESSGINFVPHLGNGNTVIFDTNSSTEFTIDGQSQTELVLKIKLQDTPAGNADSDSMGIQILGDTISAKGTLNDVKGAGAFFIWSDHSGHPHTNSSQDFLSGNLVTGIPSNMIIIKRLEK